MIMQHGYFEEFYYLVMGCMILFSLRCF